MSECSRVRERSKQDGARERVSGVSKRANGRASDPVLQFMIILALSALTSIVVLMLQYVWSAQKTFVITAARGEGGREREGGGEMMEGERGGREGEREGGREGEKEKVRVKKMRRGSNKYVDGI